MLALNNIEVGGHVPRVAPSRSELPRNDDIAADVNNEYNLFVQAFGSLVGVACGSDYLQTQTAKRRVRG